MRTKVRILANIFVEDRLDKSLFQFNRAIPVYRYHTIRAFVKNCPLIKNATEEDFQTIILITIVCSNDENALAILHGLEGCVKNSFFDELTRKKANAVDTEAIKIALNSVYGKYAFNRDTDSISEEFNNIKAVDAEELLEERRITMEDKIRVLVNIFYKNLDNGNGISQFDKNVSVDDYYKIVAFLKDCPFIESPVKGEDLQNFKMVTVMCSKRTEALAVLHGLNGCIKTHVNFIPMLLNEEDSTPKNNSVSSEIEYIAKNLDDSDLFLQMAEEAAELSQACLKYVRAHKGNNPTKDSEDVYLKGIIEEFTDVQVCAEAIDITADSDIHDSKIHRWADRIRKKNGGSAK